MLDGLLRSDSVTYYKSQLLIADSLYKNYLPQYNFEEVKAAVMFFEKSTSHQVSKSPSRDNQNNSLTWRLVDSLTHSLGDSVTRRLGDLNFLSARAHYYHAVGLTERDDVVGACEHYLRALEIMEIETKNLKAPKLQNFRTSKLQNHGDSVTRRLGDSSTQPLGDSNYEKIRFLALIYNRLGRLFYNENYCELAITKYRKALRYFEILDDNNSKANVLKELGNSYQLANKPDSALYFYNESLKYNSSLPNKLDVEKSIAQILFYEGDKDTAYSLIRNNLNMIDNENVRYSYYATLGKMYCEDKVYDSAIYYYEVCINSNDVNTKLTSAINLSSIYDSVGNKQKKAVYDNILLNLFLKDSKDIVAKSKLQSIYDVYKERKMERERTKNKEKIFVIAVSMLCIVILMFVIMILIRYRYKMKHLKLSYILKEKEQNIINKNEIINKITEEIRSKEEQLQELIFKNSFTDGKLKSKNAELQKKEELIKKYELEITSLNKKLERTISGFSNLNEYYKSAICSRILKQIEELSGNNIDTSRLEPLKQEEFFLLLNCANKYLNNLLYDLSGRYPKLKKDDLYYLCLVIVNLNDKQISSLFGVTYNTIKIRKRKICSLFNISTEEIHNFLNGQL